MIPARATPRASFRPALGQAGVNIGEFVTKFNDATRDKMGIWFRSYYSIRDRTFTFVMKTPPASGLVLKAAGY